jgi:hypothetical protein
LPSFFHILILSSFFPFPFSLVQTAFSPPSLYPRDTRKQFAPWPRFEVFPASCVRFVLWSVASRKSSSWVSICQFHMERGNREVPRMKNIFLGGDSSCVMLSLAQHSRLRNMHWQRFRIHNVPSAALKSQFSFIIKCLWLPLWSSGQSSWLQNGDVLCYLWGTNWIYICYVEESRPLLWSRGQSSWLQNGDVLCFLWGKNSIVICYVKESRPPLWSSGQSFWLQNGDVLCFLWGTNWIYVCCEEESRPSLWSSGQSSWL